MISNTQRVSEEKVLNHSLFYSSNPQKPFEEAIVAEHCKYKQRIQVTHTNEHEELAAEDDNLIWKTCWMFI